MENKAGKDDRKLKEIVKTGEEAATDVVKIPVDAVKTTVEVEKEGAKVVGKAAHEITEIPPAKQVKRFWRGLGPGLTTGSADDDPSGIVTYSQTGAKYGFQLLWLAWFSFPLMAIIQEMCARIGLQTGKGLAYNIKKHFPKWVLFLTATLVLIANSFNIGADLGALAKATQLFWPGLPFILLILFFTLLCLFLEIFISYEKYARYLKYLALILAVYVITAFVIKDFNWLGVLKSTVIPKLNFSKEQFILICAIFGTTISPYLFFWETSQEVEEKKAEGKNENEIIKGVSDKALKKMRIDVWFGMFFSNLAMFFIIAVCGAVLFPAGLTNINTAAEAAAALKPLAGNHAYLLFALGIFGTGLLGIPVLAGSASYAVSESFGWREGLNKKFKQAKAFYGVIILSMLIGLIVNFLGLDPVRALIWAAVLNGLVAPIILILIVILSSNKNVMGERTNSKPVSAFGWLVTIVMFIVSLTAIYSLF